MSDRVNANQTSQNIDRAIRIREREVQKKQISQEFQTKLATTQQQGANAREQVLSKQVLEQMAKEEEAAASMPEQAAETPVPKKTLSQEKSQKTDQKKANHEASKDKQIDKKNEKVALDLAVQKKKQQEDDSGEFGGSPGGDFFQQAVSMGMAAAQKAEAVPGGPIQIPNEVLNQIVDQVYAGVDTEGISQFVIDFKPGVLGGGRMTISAQGKAVKLKFSGLDAKSKQALRSVQGDLRNRLAGKGLDLENLEMA
jgi:hypothetical protein